MRSVDRGAAEDPDHAEDLVAEDERLASEAADALRTRPVGTRDPFRALDDIIDQQWLTAGADPSDLAPTQRKAPEVAVEPGPGRPRRQPRCAGTGGEVQTALLIRTFGAQRADPTQVASLDHPDSGKRDVGLARQPLDDARQDDIDGPLLCDRQRDRPQCCWIHARVVHDISFSEQRKIVSQRNIVDR